MTKEESQHSKMKKRRHCMEKCNIPLLLKKEKHDM